MPWATVGFRVYFEWQSQQVSGIMGEGSEGKRTQGNFQAWTWVGGAIV